MTRKLASHLICLIGMCMVLLAVPFAAIAQTGSDIEGHWAEQEIKRWVAQGLFSGYEDGSYRPDHPVSRAEFVSLINRSFGLDESADVSFTDLEPSHWSYTDVAIAVQAGYVSGFGDGTFKGEKPVSRQEAAVMIQQLIQLADEGQSVELADWDKIAEWAQQAVQAVVANEIMRGYADHSFRPDTSMTRAEAVVTLDRARAFYDHDAEEPLVVYDKAGTYGPEEGVLTVDGDVVVAAHGITLRNMEINGNLTFAEELGDGDAYLTHVTVHGETFVYGGGENSLYFENAVLVSVTVHKQSGGIRIVLSDSTTVAEMLVHTPVNLDASEVTSGGINTVKLSDLLPEGSEVTLTGSFDSVETASSEIKIVIPAGSIENFTVNDAASDVTLELGEEANILEMVLHAVANVLGEGTIQSVTVHDAAKDTTFEIEPEEKRDGSGTIIVPPAPTPPSSGGNTKPKMPKITKITPATGTVLAGEVEVAVQVDGDKLSKLELDIRKLDEAGKDGTYGQWVQLNVYADESDPVQTQETKDILAVIGVDVAYAAATKTWTITLDTTVSDPLNLVPSEDLFPDGDYRFYFRAHDAAGNVSADWSGEVDNVTYTIDNSAPVEVIPEIASITPANGALLAGEVDIVVQVDGDNLSKLEIDIRKMGEAGDGGSYGQWLQLNVYADESDPVQSDDTQAILDEIGVDVVYDAATQTWTITLDTTAAGIPQLVKSEDLFPNGEYKFYFRAHDESGNVSSDWSGEVDNVTYTIDNPAPVEVIPEISSITPASGTVLSGTVPIVVQVDGDKLSKLEIDIRKMGEAGDGGKYGQWVQLNVYADESDPVQTQATKDILAVIGVDVAYVAATKTWTIALDTTAAGIPGLVPSEDLFPNGEYKFYFRAHDVAGNVSADWSGEVDNVTYTIDNPAPVEVIPEIVSITPVSGTVLSGIVPIAVQVDGVDLSMLELDIRKLDEAGDGGKYGQWVQLNVYADESDPVQSDDTQAILDAVGVDVAYVAATKTWTIALDTTAGDVPDLVPSVELFPDGQYRFYFRAHDASGNTSANWDGGVDNVTYTIDNMVPEIVSITYNGTATSTGDAFSVNASNEFVIKAEDGNLYSLEVDINGRDLQFTVFANEGNVYGKPETKADFDDVGASASYDAANKTWTLVIPRTALETMLPDAGTSYNFQFVVKDVIGNKSGEMGGDSYRIKLEK